MSSYLAKKSVSLATGSLSLPLQTTVWMPGGKKPKRIHLLQGVQEKLLAKMSLQTTGPNNIVKRSDKLILVSVYSRMCVHSRLEMNVSLLYGEV